MRITHTTLYQASQTRLADLLGEFQKANGEVSSGKRINTLSDDPVGLSRVLDLRSSLSNLDQMSGNIAMANTWLNGAETALSSVTDIVDEAKVLSISMNNASLSSAERANAAVQVDEMLGQLLDLANTRVSGQYIFSGTKLDTKPYAFDDATNPTTAIYSGNEGAFTLKTGKDTSMAVGYSGEAVFNSQILTIDDTNNKIDFRDDDGSGDGLGAELTATIPPGSYTRDELATAIGAVMTGASASASPSPNSLTYTVTYDSATKAYSIQHNGTAVELLWDSGTNADQSIAPDIGFTSADIQGNSLSSDQSVDWGIFKTLIDLKQYLNADDSGGIERSMSRLNTQFENMNDAVARIGYKGVSLELKISTIQELNLSYNTQKSGIEDVDIVSAISTLASRESAYTASLSSTAKIMKLSLIDYM
ncbi:MAG: flagellar hook-associated protein FlgL [Pseudomonadota bacterium]